MTRKEAAEKLKSLWYFLTNNDYPQKDLDALKVAIKALEEESKTGRWRKVSMDKYIQHATYYYECSECGDQHIGQANYCPKCGCKMEVKE